MRDGSGYCAAHQDDRKIGKWGDARRGSRQSRGYDAAWEVKRKETLAEDKGLCRPCKQQGRYRPARQVDHIVNKAKAKAMGWTDEEIDAKENRQSICNDCHKEKTLAEALEARRG